MKKRILSLFLVLIMVFTIQPNLVKAEVLSNNFGDFIVSAVSGDVNTVVSYDSTNKVLNVTGNCTIANANLATATNNTISINSSCTVSLAGVNIAALAPENITDFSKPNPININGNYEVTINLVSGTINTLNFTEASGAQDNSNIKVGSGKAGLRVASGASLTIDGEGTLNATGAEGFNMHDWNAHGGGGAGIGGDGRRTSDNQDAEACGTILIKNGIVNATGGRAAGYWGGGGAGIGGGGGKYSYSGGSTGNIIIEGGTINAVGGTGGNSGNAGSGSGIGTGGQGGSSTSTAVANTVIISGGMVTGLGGNYGVQGSSITLSGDSTLLKAQGIKQALSVAPTTSDSGKIVSATNGTWESMNELVTFGVTEDPEFSTLNTAIIAAENASYSNITQEVATGAAIIEDALKATAEKAVNDSSITVTVNKVNYNLPVAGNSTNSKGTDGSYTFTITVSKASQSMTTTQKTITITATAYTGITDVQAVAAAKTALSDGSVEVAFNSTQAEKTAIVQSYVNNILQKTSDAAGVTAIVTYNNGKYDVVLSKGSVTESKSLTMTVNVAPDQDIATVNAAKIAVESATYKNMSQSVVTGAAIIEDTLKTTAEKAINDSSVTVTVNKINYSSPMEGTMANPSGINGIYTFTITVSKGLQSLTTTQKSISIIATAYISNNNNSGNIGNSTGGAIIKSENGNIIKDQQQNTNAPAVNMNNTTDDLKTKVFTNDELARLAAGENAKVILKVTDISASVSDADKKLITENLDGQTLSLYLDLSLYKKIGNDTETKITNTKGMISVSIEIPEYLWNTDVTRNRTYRIIRIHEGKVTTIDGTYDPETHLFTFETDQFSTYALTYEENNVNEIPISKDNNYLHLIAKAAKTSQKLTYTKVTGADGYIIYGAKCGKINKLKKLADVTGQITSYNVRNLKKATFYKYQVKAYKIINGKKVIIATSNSVHSITIGKTYGNPTKVTANTKAVVLSVGKSKKVTCKVISQKGLKNKYHTAEIRYESTNKDIATVNSKGTIIAVSKGSCYVVAYAQNGVYIKIKITVQ